MAVSLCLNLGLTDNKSLAKNRFVMLLYFKKYSVFSPIKRNNEGKGKVRC